MLNKSNRIIINDPTFGRLSYHKRYISPTQIPLHDRLCRMPFVYAEVRRSGGVNICCPQWNPVEIGNVLHEDLRDIWKGEKSKIIRDSIINGKYNYCNHDTCPSIQNWRTRLMVKSDHKIDELLGEIGEIPQHVLFVVDESCNLSCPSCRQCKISQLPSQEQDTAKKIISSVLNSLCYEPHNRKQIIGMDGSGEIFSSEVYREIFETETVFTQTDNWPNLGFALSTNGTMMTEKIQKRYSKFFNQIKKIEISIDAGNQESYQSVRVGGNWNLLWKNLQYFYDNIKHKTDDEIIWQWNIIVQKNNFESIPDFINIAHKFSEKLPILNFAKVLNWGTWTDEDYIKYAVHLPINPQHEDYLKIINMPLLKNYPKII